MDELNQGINSNKIFSGKGNSISAKLIYGESANLFSQLIKKELTSNKYSIIDFGSSKGEFIAEIIKKTPKFKFEITAIDFNKDDLNKNNIANKKIHSKITEDKKLKLNEDIGIMRYLLQWNSITNQEKIIKTFNKSINKFGIIQHAGADSKDSGSWRKKINKIFDGRISKLKRNGMFFSSSKEIESIFKKHKINFSKVDEIQVNELSNIFIEKYSLNPSESKQIKDIFSEKDYIVRTTWIIRKTN